MKLVKFALIAVASLLFIVVVGAGVAFFLIPAEKLAVVAAVEVKKATGRDLSITGDVSPSLYPVLGATVTQATLSNADWASDENLFSVGEATLGVRVMPLLSGRIEIEEIRLTDAAIALEVSADGEPNWTFEDRPGGDPASPQNRGAESSSSAGDEEREIELTQIGRIRLVLENAAITFDNRASGRSFATRDFALAANLESPDQPLEVEGAGVLNDQKFNLSLTLTTPLKLAGGDPALLDLSAGFGGAALDYTGTVTGFAGGAKPSAKGALSASADDLPSLVSALGAAPPGATDDTFQSLSFDGQVALSGNAAELSGMAITLDGQTVSGNASFDLGGARPLLIASLLADDLNLAPYMRGDSKGGSGKKGAGGAKKGGAKTGSSARSWSKEPIDLSVLKAIDADVSVKAQSLLLDKGTIRDADLRATLKNGELTLQIIELSMFDGGASGDIRINGAGVPKIGADLKIDSVQLFQILSSLADVEKLEGLGAATINVRSGGKNLNAIMNHLRGTASMRLTDGAILGINLAAMARNATGAFSLGGDNVRKTDFRRDLRQFQDQEGRREEF